MRRLFWPALLIVVSVVVAGCFGGGGSSGPQAPTIDVKATPGTVDVGGTVQLTATVKGPGASGATVSWAVNQGHGELSATAGNQVKWTAPGTPGTYTITATVTIDGKATVLPVQIQVVTSGGGGPSVDASAYYGINSKWVYQVTTYENLDKLNVYPGEQTIEVLGPATFRGKNALLVRGTTIVESEAVPTTAGGQVAFLAAAMDDNDDDDEDDDDESPLIFVFDEYFELLQDEIRVLGTTAIVDLGVGTIEIESEFTPFASLPASLHEGLVFKTEYTVTADISLGGVVGGTETADIVKTYEVLEVVPEAVNTPAGNFPNALKAVYRLSWTEDQEPQDIQLHTHWYDSVVGLVRQEVSDTDGLLFTTELLDYQLP